MKILFIILSLAGLGLTIIPPILVFTQTIAMDLNHQLMIGGMVLWFCTAPGWIKEQKI